MIKDSNQLCFLNAELNKIEQDSGSLPFLSILLLDINYSIP